MSDARDETFDIDRKTLHHGRKFNFELVTAIDTRGRTIRREVVRHPGAVVLVPILDRADSEPVVLFVDQHRIAIERWILELPAGTIEAGEAPETCAARELIEETGYEAATIEALGRFYTSPGLGDELMHAFLARDLSWVGQRLEPHERLVVTEIEAGRVRQMLARGDLMDAKSIIALEMAGRCGAFDGSGDADGGAFPGNACR